MLHSRTRFLARDRTPKPVKPGLHLRINQQLALTPQLQQAIRLLQLSSVELEVELREALETNPLLEMTELNGQGEAANGESAAEDSHDGVGDTATNGAEETAPREEFDYAE